jgi:hypothetical protein
MFHGSILLKNLFLAVFCGIIIVTPTIQICSQQSNPDTSDNALAVTAQFRSRLEIRSGAFRPLSKSEQPAKLISDRIRLTFDYSYKDILTTRISPQTVGIWGQSNMVQGAENDGNSIALYEAWAKLKLSKYWSLKLGRQVVSLDDERLFGELDWAQGARAHDALSVHFNKQKWEVKAFAAFNQNYKTLYGNNINNPTGNLYNTSNAFPYKEMQTIWAAFQVTKNAKLSFLATNIGFQNASSATRDTAVNYSHTIGLNYFHTNKKMVLLLSTYYQFGNNSAGKKTSAYLLAVFNSYQLSKKWNLGLGSDLVSGNDIGNVQLTDHSFNPLFHTGHKFYGSLDYYLAGNGHRNAGIADSYLKVSYKDAGESLISLAFHQFFAPVTVANTAIRYAKNLGQECDLSFTKKLNRFANLSGGYSFYITTPTLLYLKSVTSAHKIQQWFWLSMHVTPTILTLKFKS